MEIRNNTSSPSFGTFVKPKDMDKLTHYLTTKGRSSDVVYSIRNVVDKQARNKHFDLEFVDTDNSFRVVAVSEEAKKLYAPDKQVKVFPVKGDYQPSPLDATIQKIRQRREDLIQKNASPFRMFLNKIQSKVELTLQKFESHSFHLEDLLPANLREASKCATKMSDSVEKRIDTRNTIESFFS